MSRRGLACGAAVATLAVCPIRAGSAAAEPVCPDATLRPDASNLALVEAAMVCLLNGARDDRQLQPLEVDQRLEESAAAHTEDMTANGYFAHHAKGRPFLYDRIRTAGFFKGTYTALYSENLGYGPPEYASAQGMHRAFMSSDGHRLNMLYPRFRRIGIGSMLIDPNPAFYADHQAVVYTIDFGRRYVRRSRRCRKPRAAASGGTPPSRRQSARPRSYCKKARR